MRGAMRNDLDLIRKILEEVEQRETAEGEVVEVAGWPEAVVARHVERLCNDGLLDAAGSTPGLDDMADIEFFYVRDLSSAGHEFLCAIRSGDVMQRLKKTLKPSELGALSLRKMAGIAGEMAELAIRKKLGLS